MTPDLIFLRSDPSTRSLWLTIGNGPTSYQKSDFARGPATTWSAQPPDWGKQYRQERPILEKLERRRDGIEID